MVKILGSKRANGEGSIYKRKDGRWSGQVSGEINPFTGKIRRVTVYGKSRNEVQNKVRKLLNDRESGISIGQDKITLETWLSTYLNNYKKQMVRESTFIRYESIINLHIRPNIGKIQLRTLKTSDLQTLYNKLISKFSLSVVKLSHSIIYQSLKQAVKENILPRNVAENTLIPRKQKKEVRPLKKEDIADFIRVNKDNKYFLPVFLSLATGMRRGEILALLWENVNLDKGYIQISKSISLGKHNRVTIVDCKTEKSKRIVPLPEVIIKELKRHKSEQLKNKLRMGTLFQDNGLVFSQKHGGYLTTACFHKNFKRMLRESGISTDIRFHDLRHTYATMLLEAGENPKTIQELLGHANISTTLNIYSHVSCRLKEKAAEKINVLLKNLG